MLEPGNSALAEALEPGRTRSVSLRLRFDWHRDGRYATEWSDLSGNVVKATLDAQFTGQYPAAFEINDGYAQRRLTVTVTGQVAGVDVVTFFSPYSGYYGGQIGAVNTPANFSVVVEDTAAGDIELQQFAGFVLQARPKRSEACVDIELADVTSQLTNGITFPPYARSQVIAQWAQQDSSSRANERYRQRGGTSLSWYLLDICRRSGVFQGPKPPPGAVAYWTLCGGVLPEIGTLGQIPRDGRQSWPIGNNADGTLLGKVTQSYLELPRYEQSFNADPNYPAAPWSPNIDTPNVYPRYMWQRGPFGPEMRFDVYDADASNLHTVADRMRFTGATSKSVRAISAFSSRAHWVCMGGWQRFDAHVHSSNITTCMTFLSGTTVYTEGNGQYGYLQMDVSPRERSVSVQLNTNRGNYSYNRVHPELTDGVHYVAIGLGNSAGSTPMLLLNIDGTITTLDWDTGSGPLQTDLSNYYVLQGREIETSACKMETSGGAQHWGIWTETDGALSGPQHWSNSPPCLDYQTGTDIGPAMTRVMWTPETIGVSAWDLLKEIGSSDLGVIYTDEYGILRYTNWEEIVTTRDTGESTTVLTLGQVQEIDPYTTFDSVANIVAYSSQDKWFVDDAIFKASDPQQFQVASGQWARWTTVADNTMSVLAGQITPRRLAQGYWATYSGSGDNPGNAFTQQDFMRA